jgi:hypothetical protein
LQWKTKDEITQTSREKIVGDFVFIRKRITLMTNKAQYSSRKYCWSFRENIVLDFLSRRIRKMRVVAAMISDNFG